VKTLQRAMHVTNGEISTLCSTRSASYMTLGRELFGGRKSMNVDRDAHKLALVNNNENQMFPNYDEVFTRLLAKYVNHVAPHSFVPCRRYCEGAEGQVFTWGAAFDDDAALFNPNGKLAGTFSSADTALRLLFRTQGLCLTWAGITSCN
jgi:hypothetical protein